MIPFDLSLYRPVDILYLWWLGNPTAPQLVGELRTVRSLQGVSLTYSSGWLATGFSLSEDLPLRAGEFLPRVKQTAVGAVDDARPDRWGERVIRVLDKPPRTSVLDYLFFAGDERFGALGVSVSAERYEARAIGPLPVLSDAKEVERLVHQVLAGEQVAAGKRHLISPGVTLGGARPKALVSIDDEPWVLKFNERGELADMSLVEHATMTLAAKAGIRVASTRAVAVHEGHAVAVKRFDRVTRGGRLHGVSANVALQGAGEDLGYPELAQMLRRFGDTRGGWSLAQMRELFRRMVFNILVDNTDDHEKNHVLLLTGSGHWELSPAFDVLPTGQSLGYQQMRVGRHGHDSTIDNALSECAQFGLKLDEAVAEVRRVCTALVGWQSHFEEAGVSSLDLDLLRHQIDRPALLDQRLSYGRTPSP